MSHFLSGLLYHPPLCRWEVGVELAMQVLLGNTAIGGLWRADRLTPPSVSGRERPTSLGPKAQGQTGPAREIAPEEDRLCSTGPQT
jgi:hypothetical protein